ncbi:hypothetical protein FOMPIDRAFT_1016789 [Fomitopsis schrenkii]|uniref:Uncharacterized protein n=1 Tax=Fomitopsis schrenkii TaxID=2126942 RepID=S8E541_FOMSC|nr:hypothetical protein FOMPIDRAFT_1016789 [Fomitopsis schrenkii]
MQRMTRSKASEQGRSPRSASQDKAPKSAGGSTKSTSTKPAGEKGSVAKPTAKSAASAARQKKKKEDEKAADIRKRASEMMDEDSTEGDEGQPKPKKKARMQANDESKGSDVDADMASEVEDQASEEEAELPKLMRPRPKPAYGKYAKASGPSLNATEEAIARNLAGQPQSKGTSRKAVSGAASDSQGGKATKADRKADKGKAKAKASSGTQTHGKASTRLTDSEKDELEESADEGDDQYEAGEEEDADGSDGKERESGEEGDDGESGEGEEEGGRGEEGAHEEGSEDDNIVEKKPKSSRKAKSKKSKSGREHESSGRIKVSCPHPADAYGLYCARARPWRGISTTPLSLSHAYVRFPFGTRTVRLLLASPAAQKPPGTEQVSARLQQRPGSQSEAPEPSDQSDEDDEEPPRIVKEVFGEYTNDPDFPYLWDIEEFVITKLTPDDWQRFQDTVEGRKGLHSWKYYYDKKTETLTMAPPLPCHDMLASATKQGYDEVAQQIPPAPESLRDRYNLEAIRGAGVSICLKDTDENNKYPDALPGVDYANYIHFLGPVEVGNSQSLHGIGKPNVLDTH